MATTSHFFLKNCGLTFMSKMQALQPSQRSSFERKIKAGGKKRRFLSRHPERTWSFSPVAFDSSFVSEGRERSNQSIYAWPTSGCTLHKWRQYSLPDMRSLHLLALKGSRSSPTLQFRDFAFPFLQISCCEIKQLERESKRRPEREGVNCLCETYFSFVLVSLFILITDRILRNPKS